MTHSPPILLLIGAVQMCGGAPAPSTTTDAGWTCEETQIMLDIEIELGRACDADADCTQIRFDRDDDCPADSVLLHTDFDPVWAEELYEDGVTAGCPIVLPVEDDCDARRPVCARGLCSWR